MSAAENTTHLSPVIERVANQRTISKVNVAKWGLNVVILLFAILIIIIILISQGIGIDIVAPLASLGLGAVWFIGQKQGNQIYQRFYAEELSSLQQQLSEEVMALMIQVTPQEKEILNYISKGSSNKQIAFELGLSESTIKTHVTSILSKLNANDRTEAVVIAIKHGLIAI